jgi:hypothetical protein
MWLVGMAAITAACLLGANKLEASFQRSLVCGRDFAPITRRDAVDIPSYEADNMTTVRSVPLLSAAESQHVVHQPYHRCENDRLDSDIVGVRSSVFVPLPPGSAMCDVMTTLKTDLEASGWSVYLHEASEIAGQSYARAMTAEREHAQLDLSIDSRGTHLGVVADHDAPGPPFSQSNVELKPTFDCEFGG